MNKLRIAVLTLYVRIPCKTLLNNSLRALYMLFYSTFYKIFVKINQTNDRGIFQTFIRFALLEQINFYNIYDIV